MSARKPYRRQDFAYGASAVLRETTYPDDEWPYWEVIGRFYDIDGYCRKYELRWMDPETWDTKFQVVTESTALTHFEEVDPEIARDDYSASSKGDNP